LRAATKARRGHSRFAWLVRVLLLAGLLPAIPAAPACFAAPPATRSVVNKHAPQIDRLDLDGHRVDLKSLRGKVVLLNFWATWCAPCLIEMPAFSAWQQQYASQGLQVVGISMDDDAAPARQLVARLKAKYPIAMGDARLGEKYGGVMGLPLTYLIDRHGVVRMRFQGETDLKSIERQLQTLLNQR
jgi:cytochrome c biogenesis protein CcmG, thiol:disulfide interchange protein DsbE